MVVGQEHDEAVNTHTPTTSRRQAVLKGLAESLVNSLGFVVTLLLLAGLLLKVLALLKCNIQLSITT